MRMLSTSFSKPGSVSQAKKKRAQTVHISPPVKGLADDARSAVMDAKFAGVLVNMYVEDDRVTCRAGFKLVKKMATAGAVSHLIPYYGEPERLAAAVGNTLCDAETGTLLKSGFTSNDWSWTAFSNLGDTEYTVMCNGREGVWSWEGGDNADLGPYPIAKLLMPTAPATVAKAQVAAGTIGNYRNGDTVIITGGDTVHANANGPQLIAEVNTVPDTFELVNVDGSGWGSDQTTGTMTATVQRSFVREAIKAPTGNTWLDVNDLSIVVAHQNRLFFADEQNLAIYYLPIQQKNGILKVFPLNAIFKKGGTIKAMATWTLDGGMGMDDNIVIFTTNGQAAIYSGVDPATDFSLVGVYTFDPPMSKWSVINYGGELYVLLPSGIMPMSAVLKSGYEGREAADKTVVTRFTTTSVGFLNNPGWELFLNPSTGRLFCNIPRGGKRYDQMVRNMAKPAWSEFRDVPARCWGWIEPYVYFGDDDGNVYQMHPSFQSDNGVQILTDVQMAWNSFKTSRIKHFKMILAYIITDGAPRPMLDVQVDYKSKPSNNQPEITSADPKTATWDVSRWADDPLAGSTETYWVTGAETWANWTGIGGIGRVGAVRMRTAVLNCSFSITGWEVMFEEGATL